MRSLPNDKAESGHIDSYVPRAPSVVKRLQINICSIALSMRVVRVFHLIPFLQLTKHNFGIYYFFYKVFCLTKCVVYNMEVIKVNKSLGVALWTTQSF